MGEPHTTFPRCPLPHPRWRGAIAFPCCFGCSRLARFPRGRSCTWCRVPSCVRHPTPCARPPPRLLASARAGSWPSAMCFCGGCGGWPLGAGSALPLPLPPRPPPPCAVCPALVAFRLCLRSALSPLPLVGRRMRAAIAFTCSLRCSRLARFPRGRSCTWCRVPSYVQHPAPCARPPPRLLASARAGS